MRITFEMSDDVAASCVLFETYESHAQFIQTITRINLFIYIMNAALGT